MGTAEAVSCLGGGTYALSFSESMPRLSTNRSFLGLYVRFRAKASSEPRKPAAPVMRITESEVRAGLLGMGMLFVLVLGGSGSLEASSSVSWAVVALIMKRSSVSAASRGWRGFRRVLAIVDMI